MASIQRERKGRLYTVICILAEKKIPTYLHFGFSGIPVCSLAIVRPLPSGLSAL